MKTSQEADDFVQRDARNIPALVVVQADQKDLSAYYKFMGINSKEDLEKISKIHLDEMKQVEYDSKNRPFYDDLAVKTVRHTKKYEFVEVEVRIGHFIFPKITILNIDFKSPIHAQHQMATGQYGAVYKCECKGKQLAVKCFQTSIGERGSDIMLRMVLYEYCMLVLASHLKAGPKMEKVFGYSIMVFSTCIEIVMELCKDVQYKKSTLPNLQTDLKQSLLKLHSLSIIHFDIKMANLAYSPSASKYVFLDFGFSKVIKEKLGQKSLTKFKGTFEMSSSEMKKLYNSPLQSYVDVYDNDIHCLQVALFQQLKEPIQKEYQTQTDQISQQETIIDLTNFHRLYSYQYALFSENISQSLQDQLLNQDSSILQNIFIFSKHLNKSLILNQFLFKLEKIFKNTNLSNKNQYIPVIQMDKNAGKQDEEKKNNLVLTLDKINLKGKIDQMMADLKKKAKIGNEQIIQTLQNKKEIQLLQISDYLMVLSKAIELNSTKFSIQNIIEFCSVAVSFIRLDERIIEERLIPFQKLALISMFLFQKALQNKLKESYFHIFLCSLNNAVILKLYTKEQFFMFYEKVVKMSLTFTKKVRVLLNFNSMMKWFNIENNQPTAAAKSDNNFRDKNKEILEEKTKIGFSEGQLEVLKLVLSDKLSLKSIAKKQLLKFIDYDHQLLVDINIWLYFRMIGKMPYDKLLSKINDLLAEKENNSYPHYEFTYIHYAFFINYLSYLEEDQSLSIIIEKYEKVQVFQTCKILNVLKIFRQLSQRSFQIKAISNFIDKMRKELESYVNGIICHCFLQGLRRVLQRSKIKDIPQNQYVIKKFFSLLRLALIKLSPSFKSYDPMNVVVILSYKIVLDRDITVKFPRLSKMQKIQTTKSEQLINDYRQIQNLFRANCTKTSLKGNIQIMFLIFLILMKLNMIKQALQLSHRLFLVVKFANNPEAIARFLYFFLEYIRLYQLFNLCLPIQIKEYSYLYLQTIKTLGQQRIHTKNLLHTKKIIYLLLENDFEGAVQFVKRITNYFRMHKSSQNMQKLIYLTEEISQNLIKQKKKQLFSSLCRRLQISENPYYLIWHYINIHYDDNPPMSIKQLQKYFYQFIVFIHFKVRQAVKKLFLLNHFLKNWENYKTRKIVNLFLCIIRSRSILLNKSQIELLCKSYIKFNSNTLASRLLEKLANYSSDEIQNLLARANKLKVKLEQPFLFLKSISKQIKKQRQKISCKMPK